MKQTKILVECHSLLGDFVLMTPMLRALKTSFPDARIDVAVASEPEKQILFMMEGIATKCYFFNPSKMSKVEIFKLIMQFRREHYDYGFVSVSEDGKLGSLLLKAAGCKYQIGESTQCVWPNYNCPVDEIPVTHRAERNLNLLRKLGIKEPLRISNTIILDRKLCFMEQNLRKTVAVCVGTGDFIWKLKRGKNVKYNCKKWGYEKFIQLSQKLVEDGYFVIWLGGNKEKEEIEKCPIYHSIHERFLKDMIGMTNISEVMDILASSDLVIGSDTGLMHCAAALNRKTLCIIGGTDPEKIRPYSSIGEIIYLNLSCSPCYGTEKAVYCQERKCLSQISVNDVFTKAREMLKGNS